LVRFCLNKYSLFGSTSYNYRELVVLLVKFLYKKFAILFTFKNFYKGLDNQDLVNKRENRRFNIPIDYTRANILVNLLSII
ncbi:Reverse transcriptase domain-containing protein, partial [Aphis craccivora]